MSCVFHFTLTLLTLVNSREKVEETSGLNNLYLARNFILKFSNHLVNSYLNTMNYHDSCFPRQKKTQGTKSI